MKIVSYARSSVEIALTTTELVTINNALNEVCNGVHELDDDSEFATRLGVSRSDALSLLAAVSGLIKRASALPN